MVGFAESLPVYAARMQSLITQQAAEFLKTHGEWLQRFAIDRRQRRTNSIQKSLGNFVGQGVQWFGNFLKSIWSGGQALVGIVTLTVITPVVTFYLLIDWDKMVAVLHSLIPPRYRPPCSNWSARSTAP